MVIQTSSGSAAQHVVTVRRRRQAAKVKTGCITCKTRRVKCDEGKPGCMRCHKFGLPCDGYTTTSNKSQKPSSSTKALSTLKPKPPTPPTLTLYSPSMSLQLTEKENRFFQTFVKIDSHDLRPFLSHDASTFSDSFFWNGIVLQESHQTPCVKHAMVAISALAHSLQLQNSPSDNHPKNDTNTLTLTLSSNLKSNSEKSASTQEFALQQYQKAVRNLREYIQVNESGIRAQLIACLILASFDSFYGNRAFANHHISYGRKLLSDWRLRSSSTSSSPNLEGLIGNNLHRLFIRLDMQALSIFGVTGEQYSHLTVDPEILTRPIPSRFETLSEAQSLIGDILCNAYNFYMQTFHLRFANPDDIPIGTTRTRDLFISKLHAWFHSFESFLSTLPQTSTSNQNKNHNHTKRTHPLSSPQSLKLYPLLCLIRLTLTLTTPETTSDTLLPHFRFLLKLSRDVIDFEASSPEGAPAFTFEARIIVPLFQVAMKCRNPMIRRHAIELLVSGRRREAMWDSFLAGRVAKWVVGIEEEGLELDRGIGRVSEEKRCWGEDMEWDFRGRRALVRCKQGSGDGKGSGYRIRSTMITW